jgi:hypothetical protein
MHGRVASSLALTSLAALLVAAPAGAAPVAKLTVTTTLLSQPPGRSWSIGLGTAVTIANPDGSQPPALKRFRISFPRGAKTNYRSFPACSPSRLAARKGPDACPAGSRIGSGTSLVSVLPIFPQPVVAKVDVFNGPQKGTGRVLLFLARTTTPLSTQMVFTGLLKPASGRFGYTLDVTVPRIPTLPGSPDASVVAFNTLVQARRGPISYLEAPTSCPRGGLPFAGSFSFADGSTATAAAHLSCTLTSTPG